MLKITDALSIDDAELEEQFIRASGPGGQNVNKVATAVQLRFDLGANRQLSGEQKARLRNAVGRKLTKDDVIIIEADSHRTQSANREEARRRLAQLIREALPRPARRIPTRPTKGSIERRLDAKKQRGQVKAKRTAPKPRDVT